ncbi:unnamed protein product [Microthlaspi erraticum]|uniref:Uncharacterized protein n=1 Tax=Microthlaspi erraticum TaxID=1685480 RepID=A0A6D2KZR0_9BRAS|nr:unnamed protein product [Microthlaspi erraticum]
MSNNSPIFPIPHSQHFSDYGFDPQIDYFQVLEEARKHKKENSSKSSIDTLQFKLEKPISKEDLIRTTLQKKKRRWFWKKALLVFNWRKWPAIGRRGSHYASDGDGDGDGDDRDVHMARARNFRAGAAIPYLSLRELNMERQQRIGASSMSGPVYLVT